MSHEIWLVRHGETEWSLSGQHTSRTDLPLTPQGERRAPELGRAIQSVNFARILSSPLKRALDTCKLAGFTPELSEDLREWDYGAYEGLTTPAIRELVPNWSIWTGEVPQGERAEDVAARADRVIERIAAGTGPVALFSHGHFLRVLAARWLSMHPAEGSRLALGTASISVLGYERATRVIQRWNYQP